jgi:pimeloyl-ACP methyl ester carboxylesterase
MAEQMASRLHRWTQATMDFTPSTRSRPGRTPRPRAVLDGPFAEAKELVAAAWPRGAQGSRTVPAGRYAYVNGLRMYYEVHGSGRPLVVLHAALTTIDTSFAAVLPALARRRRVIAIEQQAHGRTLDIARPLSYRYMANDTAALLRQLGIDHADVLGFSMGGGAALQLALDHPELVRKLMLVSSALNFDGCVPEFAAVMQRLTDYDDALARVLQKGFQRAGARPEQWPRALTRVQELFTSSSGLQPEHLDGVRADTLIVSGQYGVVRPEHTRQLARHVPKARLEIVPGDDHAPPVLARAVELADTFLDPVVPSALP